MLARSKFLQHPFHSPVGAPLLCSPPHAPHRNLTQTGGVVLLGVAGGDPDRVGECRVGVADAVGDRDPVTVGALVRVPLGDTGGSQLGDPDFAPVRDCVSGAVIVAVSVGVRVPVAVVVLVRVLVGDDVLVRVPVVDAVLVRVPVDDAVLVRELVADAVLVLEPLTVALLVLVELRVPVTDAVIDCVARVVRVPVGVACALRVLLTVLARVCVADSDGATVWLLVLECEAPRERLDTGVFEIAGDCDAAGDGVTVAVLDPVLLLNGAGTGSHKARAPARDRQRGAFPGGAAAHSTPDENSMSSLYVVALCSRKQAPELHAEKE